MSINLLVYLQSIQSRSCSIREVQSRSYELNFVRIILIILFVFLDFFSMQLSQRWQQQSLCYGSD